MRSWRPRRTSAAPPSPTNSCPVSATAAASYTVSLLNPKVIHDLELERHGLKVVLRKTDNFLPGAGDYLLSGRNGLTRKEIVRHVTADGDGYDNYIASWKPSFR